MNGVFSYPECKLKTTELVKRIREEKAIEDVSEYLARVRLEAEMLPKTISCPHSVTCDQQVAAGLELEAEVEPDIEEERKKYIITEFLEARQKFLKEVSIQEGYYTQMRRNLVPFLPKNEDYISWYKVLFGTKSVPNFLLTNKNKKLHANGMKKINKKYSEEEIYMMFSSLGNRPTVPILFYISYSAIDYILEILAHYEKNRTKEFLTIEKLEWCYALFLRLEPPFVVETSFLLARLKQNFISILRNNPATDVKNALQGLLVILVEYFNL
eukprot:snap_masked-scaffold_29-processed-gene-3.5-mRNA-1 protein AED:1.00 eAED:1.00 QI:0/-1/0/0/-1/1/1/0/269